MIRRWVTPFVPLLLVAACSHDPEHASRSAGQSAGSASPSSRSADRNWWCVDTRCVATKDDCARLAEALHVVGTCQPHASATCSHGCEQVGGKRLCSPSCAVDLDACEHDTARATSCREEAPPAHPELFPRYVEPGWWCGGSNGGAGSGCEKSKEDCEDTLHTACTRATGPVYCWSRHLAGALAMATKAGNRLGFLCTTTLALCEQTLASARATSSGDFEIVSDCAVWPYD